MDEFRSEDATGVVPPADDVELARQDIEKTRTNMSETLGAIREKLDPQQMMDQAKSAIHDVTDDVKNTVHTIVSDVSSHAKETAKDATTGAISGAVDEVKEAVGTVVDSTKKVGSNVMDTVKNNPIPSLVLFGAGWYILSRRKAGLAGASAGDEMNSILGAALKNPIPAALVLGTAMHLYHNHDASPTLPSSNGGASVASLASKASDVVAETKDAVKDKLGDAASAVKETAGKASDAAGSLASTVGDSVKQAGTSLKGMVQANPLTVGLYALGIGATIAFLLPDSEPENSLMGGARDSLMATAKQSTGNLLDKVHDASVGAIDAASTAAKETLVPELAA
jgi:gas vesicle protein